jgi:replicative DNA helicase
MSVTYRTFTNEDSEKSILAFLLADVKDLKYKETVISKCRPEFFTGRQKTAFGVIASLVVEGVNPTCDIVYERAPEGFSRFELEEIKDLNASYSNYGFYIRNLVDVWKRRAIYNTLGTALGIVQENPRFDSEKLLEEVKRQIAGIERSSTESKIFTLADCMSEMTEDIAERMKPDYKSDRIPTGLNCLDSKMGGLAPSEMTIIGARPSQGKTALALTMFRNITLKNIPAGFISLEMSREALAYRLASMQTGYNQYKLQNLPRDENTPRWFSSKVSQIADVPGFIADTPNAPLYEVELTAKKLVNDCGAKILFIDYAGLIARNPGDTKTAEYERQSELSKRMKGLARTLNVPVVLLVQLNRDAQEKPATLANIRGSGSYEQDADVIVFIQKDENVGTYLSVAKNRNGSTGNAKVVFNRELTLFTDVPPDTDGLE